MRAHERLIRRLVAWVQTKIVWCRDNYDPFEAMHFLHSFTTQRFSMHAACPMYSPTHAGHARGAQRCRLQRSWCCAKPRWFSVQRKTLPHGVHPQGCGASRGTQSESLSQQSRSGSHEAVGGLG